MGLIRMKIGLREEIFLGIEVKSIEVIEGFLD